jgi:CHAT domain-containing protein
VPLPAVPVEVETIATQLWPGTTLLNETFTFDNLQTTQRQRHFGIVHLATHGEFLPGMQPIPTFSSGSKSCD